MHISDIHNRKGEPTINPKVASAKLGDIIEELKRDPKNQTKSHDKIRKQALRIFKNQ